MNTMNSSKTNPAQQILAELITFAKEIDNNLTKLEELLNEIEKRYIEMDNEIELLKKQIK